ncbi:MAG: DUF2924 domain-containing protein [Pseudomonadota bacterium]|nr:DUF2924 domain-containing protein [Pseudomonadota bacterium]
MFGRTAPAHLSRQLLLRTVAYEVQVQKHADLSRETKRLLAAISTAASGRSAGSGKDVPVPPAPDLRPLMPGAELVREHDGVLHRVMVLRDGFAWKGSVFASLHHRHALERTPLLRTAGQADQDGPAGQTQ